MPNKPTYLSESYLKYADENIPNWSRWVQQKVLQHMETHKDNIKQLKQQYKKAKRNNKERKDALSVLIPKCDAIAASEFKIGNFLTGASGKKLLDKAEMSIDEFMNYYTERKGGVLHHSD